MVSLKTAAEIETMAEGGRRLAGILKSLRGKVKVGIKTADLEKESVVLIRESGAEPAFLGYRPAGGRNAYPYSLCVSVNECVVHGQPSEYVIKEGDIVKLDLGLKYRGFYVDSAITVPVGNVSREASKLVEATKEALKKAIEKARIGNTTGDIGYVIEKIVSQSGFSIVKSLTGHGIGRELHEEPQFLNFGNPGEGMELKAGMVLAIEPMVAMGSGKIKELKDESFATADGSLSAHFEHTVAVTESGPRILT